MAYHRWPYVDRSKWNYNILDQERIYCEMSDQSFGCKDGLLVLGVHTVLVSIGIVFQTLASHPFCCTIIYCIPL